MKCQEYIGINEIKKCFTKLSLYVIDPSEIELDLKIEY